MPFQIYKDHQHEYLFRLGLEQFRSMMATKVFSQFDDIEAEAENFANSVYNRLGASPGNENVDMSDVAEHAIDQGTRLYLDLSLVSYQLKAMAISTLFHLWEQQLRKFLYDEIRHNRQLNFTSFCAQGLRDIKNVLLQFDIDIETFRVYPKIRELRLLSNVIKQGDGDSADRLRAINSNYFLTEEDFGSMVLPLDTTFLEENLNIQIDTFDAFVEALKEFWIEFPERSFTENLEI